MKLKALLLGSAAALIAVSGAHAADAVVAEPEPVDYVKVCDMYGAGFFYIPGTENCLKIGGYMRVQYDITTTDVAGATDTSEHGARVDTRLTFDARSETDYGTLRGFARVDGNRDGTVVTDMTFSNVYIELGNFSTGFREIRSAIAAGYGIFDGNDQNFGNVFYADYTWAANGLSVVGGVGADDGDEDNGVLYLRADYSGAMYTIAGSITHILHDQTANESVQEYNVWGQVTPMDGLGIRAYYNDNSRTGSNGRWGVGVNFAIMDDVSVSANYFDTDGTGSGMSGQVAWTIAPDLSLTFAAQSQDLDAGGDTVDYKVRLNRSF